MSVTIEEIKKIASWCRSLATKSLQASVLKTSIIACEKSVAKAYAMVQQDDCLKDV